MSDLDLNPKVLAAQHAVRGPITQRSLQIIKELRENPDSHPYKAVSRLNIGNPQL